MHTVITNTNQRCTVEAARICKALQVLLEGEVCDTATGYIHLQQSASNSTALVLC